MNNDLESYGYRILPSGRFFSIAKDRELGVVHSVKRGRNYYRNADTGALIASGMDPIAFVVQFWFAKQLA